MLGETRLSEDMHRAEIYILISAGQTGFCPKDGRRLPTAGQSVPESSATAASSQKKRRRNARRADRDFAMKICAGNAFPVFKASILLDFVAIL